MSQPPNLRDLLVDRRDELILRVNQSVEGYVVSGTMTRREVEDHLPELIDQIVAALSVDLGQPPSQPPTASRYTAVEHGQQRLRVGFSVEAVMYEYDILRETIFDLAEEAGVTVHRWESRLVSESIDRAAFVAVREYQRQRDDALDRVAGEHLAFLAHELRNPLTSARTAMAVLRRGPLAEGGRSVDVVERNLTRLQDLIDQELVAQRIKRASPLHVETVSVTDLLTAALEESAVDAQSRGLSVSIEVEAGLNVEADPRMLRSVVTNLLRNAVKFSRRDGAIALRARREEERVAIDVEDECGGLDPATMSKLFEPFVQAGVDRSGFGLGLAIARAATEAHGGTLEVRNLPGKGCVFSVTLPVGARA